MKLERQKNDFLPSWDCGLVITPTWPLFPRRQAGSHLPSTFLAHTAKSHPARGVRLRIDDVVLSAARLGCCSFLASGIPGTTGIGYFERGVVVVLFNYFIQS